MKNNRYAVIMAGGIGSRFWPMSTEDFPKQFHDVLGTGKTLIQQTFERLSSYCPKENIFVVTNKKYNSLVQQQLPELGKHQILGEPVMRNTAPCIAYVAYKINKIDPDAVMTVAPSDHLIMNQNEFLETLEIATNEARNENLVTLGIKPSRPDTGYGYIQFEDESIDKQNRVRGVKTFTEKPDLKLAKEFVDSGDFYWNSGIFVWKAKTIVEEFHNSLPDVSEIFDEGFNYLNTEEEENFIEKNYAHCTNISIDYGILERSKRVSVVLSDFGWSDLGTWGSLYTHLPHDEQQNAVVGDNVHVYDSEKCIIRMPHDKTVIIQGLSNCIVVESMGTLLICKKEEEQQIKQLVKNMKRRNTEQLG